MAPMLPAQRSLEQYFTYARFADPHAELPSVLNIPPWAIVLAQPDELMKKFRPLKRSWQDAPSQQNIAPALASGNINTQTKKRE